MIKEALIKKTNWSFSRGKIDSRGVNKHSVEESPAMY